MDRLRAWLEDKRNMPIVIAGFAVIIVGVVLLFWQPWAAKAPAAQPPTMPGAFGAGPNGMAGSAGMTPGMATGATGPGAMRPGAMAPGGMPQGGMMPGSMAPGGMPQGGMMPGSMAPGGMAQGGMTPGSMVPGSMAQGGMDMGTGTGGTQPVVAAAPIKPMEAWRADPFQPIGYKKPSNKAGKRVIRIVKFPQKVNYYPWELIATARPRPTPVISKEPTFTPQPYRRMAGILMNGRVFAIIETNGQYDIVKPGDMLTDKLATVEKIMRDRVILKSTDPKPRYMTVYLTGAQAGTTGIGGTMPGMSGAGTMGNGGVPGGIMGPGGMMGPGGAMGPGSMMGPGGAMGPGGMMGPPGMPAGPPRPGGAM